MSRWFNLKKGAKIVAGLGFGGFLLWLHETLSVSLEGESASSSSSGIISSTGDFLVNAASYGLTGAAAIPVIGALGTAGHLYHRKRALQEFRYVRITPHADTRTSKEAIAHLVKAFWRSGRPQHKRFVRGREWFQLLFCCEEGVHEKGDISIFFGFPQDRWTYLSQSLKDAYPNSEITLVKHDQVPLFAKSEQKPQGLGRVLTWNAKEQCGYPLQAFSGTDKISKILNHLEPGSALAVTFSKTTAKHLKKQTQKTRHHLYKEVGFNPKEMSPTLLDADVQSDLHQLKQREQSNQDPFEVSIAMYNAAGHEYVIESLTNAVNAALATQNSLARTWFSFGTQPIQLAPQYIPVPDFLNHRMVMTGMELANVLHLPNGKDKGALANQLPHLYDRIPHIMRGQSLLPATEFTHGVRVGEYINPAQGNRPVHIDPEQLRYHGIILGKTGSGKGALGLEITTDLIEKRLKQKTGGFTLIDPKATFAQNLLTRINKMKIEGNLTDKDLEKFHYFDVSSQEYSFGLNPLERPHGRPPTRNEAEQIIDRTLDVFKAAWAAESILFERFGRLILKSLLADPDEQHTILALPEFLREESPLRDRLLQKLKQGNGYAQEIARDLEEEVNKGNFASQKTDALVNRLTRIKESATLRRIFGQQKTTINPLKWMEEGHIVLFNTMGISPELMSILMGYIVYEYSRHCRTRKNKNENHYLLIDEAHHAKGLDVLHRRIIPEDREFGLCLLLMSQMLHQFPAPFFDALTEVAGTYMSCEVGAENAKILEKVTQRRINSETVQGLQKLTTVIDATDSKGQRLSFIVRTAPPVIYHVDGTPTYYGEDKERTSREKEKALSDCLKAIGEPLMQRDCLPVSQIEAEIDTYIASLSDQSPKAPERLIQAANTPKGNKRYAKKQPVASSKRLIIPKKKGGGVNDNPN